MTTNAFSTFETTEVNKMKKRHFTQQKLYRHKKTKKHCENA